MPPGRFRRFWRHRLAVIGLLIMVSAAGLALSIVALMGPSLRNIIVVFAITTWPVYARTMRGIVLVLRVQEFVQAARRRSSPALPSC